VNFHDCSSKALGLKDHYMPITVDLGWENTIQGAANFEFIFHWQEAIPSRVEYCHWQTSTRGLVGTQCTETYMVKHGFISTIDLVTRNVSQIRGEISAVLH